MITRLLRQFPVLGHFVLPLMLVISLCGGVAAWLHEHDQRVVEQSRYAEQLRRERDNTARYFTMWAQAGETLRIRSDGVTVTRDRYVTIRDTIRLGISRGDTNVILANLPSFLAASDSAVSKCTQYQNACEVYRHVSDSLVAALRRQIALHETRETPTLPRLRLTADALYDPVTQTPAMAAGLELRVAGPVAFTLSGLERFGDTPRLYVGVRGVF